MIGLVFGLLGSKPAGLIGAGLSLVLVLALLGSCVQLKAKDRTIKTQGRQIAQLAQDLGTCRGNVATLKGSLERQNRAVEALHEAGAQRERDAAKAVQDAQRGRSTAERRVADILKAKPGADACASADDLILESLR